MKPVIPTAALCAMCSMGSRRLSWPCGFLGWSRNTALTVNGEAVDLAAAVRDGYAMLNRQFHEGDVIELTLDMTPRKVFASSKIPADTGCAAVQRGPLVYCTEGVDNGGDILSLSLNRDGALREEDFDAGLLGGVVPVLADGWRTQQTEESCTRPAGPEGRKRKSAWCPIIPGETAA